MNAWDAADIDGFCAAWAAAVGPDRLLRDGADLDRYARTTLPRVRRATAVVRPQRRAEVAEALRLAGRYGVELHPISRGRNTGFGDACPPRDGAVLLDLGALDRIVSIDEELGVAVVEP